jgi:hypothetical protein
MMKSKSLFIAVLIGGAILLGVSSCATVPTEPLAPGEVRLLSGAMAGVGGDTMRAGLLYDIKVNFKADGEPQIRRACFTWSGDGPYCYFVKPTDVVYGLPGVFRVALSPSFVGSHRVECYAEYFQDRKLLRTNVIGFQIFVGL